jgi:uncharacterized protein with FMN-binding domain
MAIYAAGYLNTRDEAGATTVPAPVSQPALTSGGAIVTAPTATVSRGRADTLPSAPASASGSTQASYRDGQYTGLGTSRHGNIEVQVVVQGGRIVSADVSRCATRYPCSRISSLTGETVQRQAAPVNYVSGATDSSNAYKAAVRNALAQALAQG